MYGVAGTLCCRCRWQAGTRTLFRTRISYYRERIVKCQRLFTSYREVTKARKRALINKWTRCGQGAAVNFHASCTAIAPPTNRALHRFLVSVLWWPTLLARNRRAFQQQDTATQADESRGTWCGYFTWSALLRAVRLV